jgi:hypothetical protein
VDLLLEGSRVVIAAVPMAWFARIVAQTVS